MSVPPTPSPAPSAAEWLRKLRQTLPPGALADRAGENDAAISNGRRRRLGGGQRGDAQDLDAALAELDLDDPLRQAFETLAAPGSRLGLLRHVLTPEDVQLHEALRQNESLMEDDGAMNRLAACAGGWDIVHRLAASSGKNSKSNDNNDHAALDAQREALASQVAAARRDCEALEATLAAADTRRVAAGKLMAAKDIDSTMDEFRTFFRKVFPSSSSTSISETDASADVTTQDPVPAHLATSPCMKEFFDSERRLAAEIREVLISGMRQTGSPAGLTWEQCQLRDLVVMEELPESRSRRLTEIDRLARSIAEAHRQECLAATAMAHVRLVRATAQKCADAGASNVSDAQLLALGLRPPQELRAELMRLDDELRRLMNGIEMQQACRARGNAAVAAVKATDAAIVSARNAYFYENHAPVLAASEAQQTRLEFVQAELLRERTRFAEFVVESVTGAGKDYKDLAIAARARMDMYETMLSDVQDMQRCSFPLLDMLIGKDENSRRSRLPIPAKSDNSGAVGDRKRRRARHGSRNFSSPEERATQSSDDMKASLVKSKADAAEARKAIEAKISKMLRGRNILLQECLGEVVGKAEKESGDEAGGAQGAGAEDRDAVKLVVKGLSQMTPEVLRNSIERHVKAKVELERKFREISSSSIGTNAYWRKKGDSRKA